MMQKENMIHVLEYKEPEYVPFQPEAFQMIRANAIHERPYGYVTGYDCFGVHWTSEDGLPVPTAGVEHVLKDITQWRGVVRFPDLDNWDWETEAKRDCADQDPDKLTFIIMGTGPFERLHAQNVVDNEACSEEDIRREVRAKIDLLAPGGGDIPFGVFRSPRNAIALDKIRKYGRDFYKMRRI